jgi:hypothetical protein
LRSAEVRRAERAWFTPARDGLDAAWVGLVLVNLVAIAVWPSWDTVPFHLISTGFAVLYGLRLWPADPVLWGLGIVIITTFAGIGLDLLRNNESLEEAAEIPLLAAMFVAIVWHANRRIAADRERQLIGEKNSRLLEALIRQPPRYKNVIRYNARSPRWRHRQPSGQLNHRKVAPYSPVGELRPGDASLLPRLPIDRLPI